MSTQIIESYLPWDRIPDEERRFWRITAIMLGIPVVLSVAISYVKLPEVSREQRDAQAAESRIVKLAMTHKVELPKAVQKELEQEKKAEAEKKEEAKPDAKPEQKTVEEVAPKPEATPAPVENKAASKIDVQKAAAREKAAQVMQEQGFSALAGLADEAVGSEAAAMPGMGGTAAPGLIRNGAEAPGTSRNMINSRAGRDSGGLSGNGYGGSMSSGLGGGVPGGKNAQNAARNAGLTQGVDANKLATVKSNIADAAAGGTAPKVGKDGRVRRSDAAVNQSIDRLKTSLFAVFNRALRDNPALQGTVVVKMTVAPDGSVSDCNIVSSELGDPTLEAKILSRVKLFNFGPENVEPWQSTISFNFVDGG